MNDYRIFPLGTNALTIEFGNVISETLNEHVVKLADYFEKNQFQGFIESVPAYASLTIFYQPLIVRKNYPQFANAFTAVSNFAAEGFDEIRQIKLKSKEKLIEIPVNFSHEFALDLEFVAARNNLTAEKVIEFFTIKIYRVFMLGFLPAFAYMGEIDERIVAPRKDSPRLKVPKGSVGIAGRQTGIYPFDSPGGWQIIGSTDFRLFTPRSRKSVRFASRRFGQILRFNQMSLFFKKPGILTTVQDLGRNGYRRFGINPNGSMDKTAARLSNILLGNDENEAVLEMHFPAPEIIFEENAIFTIGGADLGAKLNNETIENRRIYYAGKDSTFKFTQKTFGNRAYLAVKGGFKLESWLTQRKHQSDGANRRFRGTQITNRRPDFL